MSKPVPLPPYPLVAVYARDWMIDDEPHGIHFDYHVATGWGVGWLIQETQDSLSIAMEYFDADVSVRHVQTYPKETIIKIVKLIPRRGSDKSTQGGRDGR